MSYLLDAMNRTERDMRNQKMPTLDSVHEIPQQSNSRRWLLPGVLMLLVINIGVLGYLYWPSTPEDTTVVRNSPGTDHTETAHGAQTLAPAPVASPVHIEALAPVPSLAHNEAPAPATISAQDASPVSAPVSVPAQVSVQVPVQIADLPVRVQRQIPDLSFTSHIHSSDPSLRMVGINSRILHEGDDIAQGMKLLSITEDGVIISYLHYTFEVSMMRGWSF